MALAAVVASPAPVTLGLAGVLGGSLAAAAVFAPRDAAGDPSPIAATPGERGAGTLATGSAGVAVLLFLLALGRAAPVERTVAGVPSPTDPVATDRVLGLRAEKVPGRPGSVLVAAPDGGGPGPVSLPRGYRASGVRWERPEGEGPATLLIGTTDGATFAVPFHRDGYRLDDGPSARLRGHVPGWLAALLGVGLGLGAAADWLRLETRGVPRRGAQVADAAAVATCLIVAAALVVRWGQG